MIYSFCFFISILASFLNSILEVPDSDRQARILVPFFKTLLEKTETGYVLYDAKPVCIESYTENVCPFEPFEWHELSNALFIAKKVLKKPFFQTGNIIFHIDENSKVLVIINRKLFLETIQNNLLLFQYVLGPTVTPDSLLEAITSPHNSFMATLNNDKVLIGIVLGYGAQNSLFHSRRENIEDAKLSVDDPPLNSVCQTWKNELGTEVFLFLPHILTKKLIIEKNYLKPSFGFTSIQQESKKLSEILEPSHLLSKLSPPFFFGCINDYNTNQTLFKTLEIAEKKINELKDSPQFLNTIFKLISGKNIELNTTKIESFPVPKINLNLALAKLLKLDLENYEQKYYPSFFQGFLNESNFEYNFRKEYELSGFSQSLQAIKKAKFNLENANEFFKHLKNKKYKSIYDNLLYFKILKNGSGQSLINQNEVVLNYEIYDPEKKCLKTASNATLNLCKTIPGFVHGIKGMKIGETRVIFIHPSLAYGVHTFLEKGIYLKAKVTLLEIKNSEGNLPPLIPVDLSYYHSERFIQECEEEHKKTLHYLGNSRAKFLRLCPNFNLQEIAKIFTLLTDKDTLTNEEYDALNQIFWNVFFVNSPKL